MAHGELNWLIAKHWGSATKHLVGQMGVSIFFGPRLRIHWIHWWSRDIPIWRHNMAKPHIILLVKLRYPSISTIVFYTPCVWFILIFYHHFCCQDLLHDPLRTRSSRDVSTTITPYICDADEAWCPGAGEARSKPSWKAHLKWWATQHVLTRKSSIMVMIL